MSSDLTLKVGAISRTRTFKKPDVEMKQYLIDFVNAKGHNEPAESLTNAQLGDAALLYLVDHTRETVGVYRGERQKSEMDAAYQLEKDAARDEIEVGVDV